MLGRYAKWLLERADAGQRGELDSVMAGVCERCGDHNRRVQVRRGVGLCAGAAGMLSSPCLRNNELFSAQLATHVCLS